jgi:hypothetical protein
MYETMVDSSPVALHRLILLFRHLQVRVPRGQIAAARNALTRVEGVPVTESHGGRWQVMLHLSGFSDSLAAHQALLVLAKDPDPTDRFWAGALAAAEGRWSDVDDVGEALGNQAQDLRGMDSLSAAGYADAYAAALRAYTGLLQGERERLAEFETALGRLPPHSYAREQPQQFLRYQVGKMLFDWERLHDAERYFSSFQPYDYFYTSQAELFLGRINEALDRPEEALVHYHRFVTWWEFADPSLRPLWQEGRQALARLGGEPRKATAP